MIDLLIEELLGVRVVAGLEDLLLLEYLALVAVPRVHAAQSDEYEADKGTYARGYPDPGGPSLLGPLLVSDYGHAAVVELQGVIRVGLEPTLLPQGHQVRALDVVRTENLKMNERKVMIYCCKITIETMYVVNVCLK